MAVVTPVLGAAKGAIAGAVGTVAMDTFRYVRYRQGGGEEPFADWETAEGVDSYDEAGTPAEVGRTVVEHTLHAEPAPHTARVMTMVMHWGTGMAYGLVFGAVAALLHRKVTPAAGALLGTGAWATSTTILGATGFYRPVWEYQPKTVGEDLAGHLLFGLAAAGAYRGLSSR